MNIQNMFKSFLEKVSVLFGLVSGSVPNCKAIQMRIASAWSVLDHPKIEGKFKSFLEKADYDPR